MNLCLITETYPPEVNGVAMTNRRLVRGLEALGHQVTVIRPRQQADRKQPPASSSSIQEFTVRGLPVPGYSGIQMGLPVYYRLKRLFTARQAQLVHIATEGPLGIASLIAARHLNLPVTSTFHTNFQLYCEDYGARWLTEAMLKFLRGFHNRCALTFVPSTDLIASLEKDAFERLIYLGRGVDRELFNPERRSAQLREQWGVHDNETPIALYAGRAASEKNIPLAIEAFYAFRQKIPAARMVVVGDGPVKNKMMRKYPDVHFAGMRYDEDLAAHYASADLFFFGSTSETFGNVITEAMTSGLIPLVYDYAAGQRYIRQGINGILAKFDDPNDFIAKAQKLADLRTEWPAMRIAATEATKEIPWSKIIKEFESHLLTAHATRI